MLFHQLQAIPLRYYLFFVFWFGVFGLEPRMISESPYLGYSPDHEARIQRVFMELKLEGKSPKPRKYVHHDLPSTLGKPVHVMLFLVDHWEPSIYGKPWDNGIYESEASRLADYWLKNYRRTASRHRDADGRMPQHTWFTYQLAGGALQRIAKCAFLGLGEQEIHIHHGTMDDRTKDHRIEFIKQTAAWIDTLQSFGALLTAEPKPRTYFGFIHGNWALDNSRVVDDVRQLCGVNNELNLLLALGCYGDFTFPSGGSTQPKWLDKIFVSRDSDQPKSYDDPKLIRELTNGGAPIRKNELMLFEGPGEDGLMSNVDEFNPPTLEMMDVWVEENVHVPGREDWIFVKLYTHSAQNLASSVQGQEVLVGQIADKFYSDIERVYNDGTNFKLHYVTSREAYNIVRAAVDGKNGDPNRYRDYVIPAPANTRLFCDAQWHLISYDASALRADLEVKGKPQKVELWARDFKKGTTILESNSTVESSFKVSDAQVTAADSAPLIVRDATPSRYYRLVARR